MNDDARQAVDRGIEWLLAQQGADGGWHSATYGQLKDGAAVTTLVLDALSRLPQAGRHLPAIRKGLAFLDRGLARRGTIASPDGSLDFPTYAAALWLTTRRRLELAPPAEQRKRLIEYLLGAQVVEGRGFAADSPSYGGWDFLGKGDAQGITTGTNISVTRYVLEALAQESEAGLGDAIEDSVRPAKAYVLRCQQPDGGFAFTCEKASLNNKAAYSDEELTRPRPYATATCDGVLALIACGAAAGDERVAKAIDWLVKRPSLEVVPGFEGLPPEAGWQRGLRYYYYAGLASALAYFPAEEGAVRRRAVAGHVVALQTKDGSWINESDRMRENDPLIATALALTVLALAAQSIPDD